MYTWNLVSFLRSCYEAHDLIVSVCQFILLIGNYDSNRHNPANQLYDI